MYHHSPTVAIVSQKNLFLLLWMDNIRRQALEREREEKRVHSVAVEHIYVCYSVVGPALIVCALLKSFLPLSLLVISQRGINAAPTFHPLSPCFWNCYGLHMERARAAAVLSVRSFFRPGHIWRKRSSKGRERRGVLV